MHAIDTLLTIRDLVLVCAGFGAIVFLHELGHFLAAKWAGVRVLAFAVGFGPAIVSYRKGLGFRRGSSDIEYRKTIAANPTTQISPTEYRLNGLPFGGYVKMLGQDDLDPGATSVEPDSYQNCPIPKRLVIISAGVVVNLITAALIFLAVFSVGLRMEPALVGAATPGSPAAKAVPANARQAGVLEAGLMTGDRIAMINGRAPDAFTDLVTAAGLAGPGDPVRLEIEREGISETLRFDIVPERGETTGLLELGVAPAVSLTLEDSDRPGLKAQIAGAIEAAGLTGVPPGSTLVSADGEQILLANQLSDVYAQSGGAPVELVFKTPAGESVSVTTEPVAELEVARAPMPGGTFLGFRHLLGLTPVLTVERAEEGDAGYDQGLRSGDLIVQAGTVEYPSVPEGIAEVREASRSTITLTLGRSGEEITVRARVSGDGLIGFLPGSTAATSTLVTRLPAGTETVRGGELITDDPSGQLGLVPGTRIAGVRDTSGVLIETSRLVELRDVLQTQLTERPDTAPVLVIELPSAAGPGATIERAWELDQQARERLMSLRWDAPFSLGLFKLETEVVRAEGVAGAFRMGLDRTQILMTSTYLTLARLFQGTVKVEHLKGPVGIAHAGTIVAQRGFLWLLFFGAVVSVNLAVINFLPLPIVDGGQFLMLLAEWIRGKPVPIVLQNAITLAGLALIGTVFLVVTFNDITNLLGS
ncbi:MAG: site-2 protease family protein [Planctomycetota bacterium]